MILKNPNNEIDKIKIPSIAKFFFLNISIKRLYAIKRVLEKYKILKIYQKVEK